MGMTVYHVKSISDNVTCHKHEIQLYMDKIYYVGQLIAVL